MAARAAPRRAALFRLAVTRTAACLLAWVIATAFFSRHEIAPDAGKAPEAQPSLIGTLVSATAQ